VALVAATSVAAELEEAGNFQLKLVAGKHTPALILILYPKK
jgi:hypothetical protein